jgi:hypothetical protein
MGRADPKILGGFVQLHLTITETGEPVEYQSKTSSFSLPPESFELLTNAIITVAGIIVTGIVTIILKKSPV